MDRFSEYLTTALAILSLTSIAGLGYLRTTLVNLRAQVDDADKEAARFQRSRDEERAERMREQAEGAAARAELLQQVAACQAEIEVLRRTVTGEVHWVTLGEQLEHLGRQLSELAVQLVDHADALTHLQASAADHWRTEIEALVAIRQTQVEREARNREQS